MMALDTSLAGLGFADDRQGRHEVLNDLDHGLFFGGGGTLDVVDLHDDGVSHGGLLVAVAVDVHGAARVGRRCHRCDGEGGVVESSR